MALTANPTWRQWKWEPLQGDASDATLEIEVRLPTWTDRVRLESLEGDAFVLALKQVIRSCVRNWRGVATENPDGSQTPLDFSPETLLEVLGQYPVLGAALAAKIMGGQANEPAKNPPTPGEPSPGG